MRLTEAIARLFRPRAADPALDERFWAGEVSLSKAGQWVSTDTAEQYITLQACVDLFKKAFLMLPPQVLRYTEAGKFEVPGHAAGAILRKRPNPYQKPYQFKALMMHQALLAGNAFAEVRKGPEGPEMWPLAPVNVEGPELLSSGRRRYLVAREGGRKESLLGDVEIMHVTGLWLDSSGMRGKSIVDRAREALGMALAADSYGAKLFASGVKFPGVLTMPGAVNDPSLGAAISDSFKRQSESGYPLLEQGMDFKSMGMTNDDAQFLETRKFSVSEIARLFGVPPHMIGDVERSTSWGCLPGDSQVFTVDGPRPIEDVTVGMKVWSLAEGSGLVVSDVTAKRMTGIHPLLTIETSARTLRATANHRVPIRRYLGRAPGRRAIWTDMWVRADQVALGDHLMVPHSLTPGVGTTAPNGRVLTVAAMEFCGLYLGDGSLDGNRVEIAHEDAPDHMDYYRGAIASEFGVTPYVDRSRLDRSRFSSKEAVALLSTGFTGTALTKRVPGWVFGLRPDLQLAMLRGYLDSDGSVQRGRIIYSSAHKALLEDVRHLCIGLGIPTGRVCLGRPGGEGVIAGRTHNSGPKYQLSLSSLSFNGRIGSHSPRKAARFVGATPQKPYRYDADWRGAVSSSQPAVGADWHYSDLALHRVTKLSRGRVAVPVYDISVADTSSFVADGVLVHNSGIEAQTFQFVTYALLPWLTIWQECFEAVLVPEDDVHIRFNVGKLMQADMTSRFGVYKSAIDDGILSPNECRELEDWNPREGGDEYREEPRGNASGGAAPMPAKPEQMPMEDQDARAGLVALRREVEMMRGAGDDARALTLAGWVAGKLLAEEVEALMDLAQKHAKSSAEFGHATASFYGRHAVTVAAALSISKEQAATYCRNQRLLLAERGASALSTWTEEHLGAVMDLALRGQPPALSVTVAPAISIAQPAITVTAPVVNVAPASVTMPAPVVNVAPAPVTVNVEARAPASLEFTRDKAGNVVRATERPVKE